MFHKRCLLEGLSPHSSQLRFSIKYRRMCSSAPPLKRTPWGSTIAIVPLSARWCTMCCTNAKSALLDGASRPYWLKRSSFENKGFRAPVCGGRAGLRLSPRIFIKMLRMLKGIFLLDIEFCGNGLREGSYSCEQGYMWCGSIPVRRSCWHLLLHELRAIIMNLIRR